MTRAIVTDTMRVPARMGPDVYSPTVQLAYEPGDPYAVWLLFPEDEDGPEWSFSRELLAAGIQGSAGQGDIKVWSGDRTVYVQLDSPVDRTTTVVHLPRFAVSVFLFESLNAVPWGEESAHLDVDRAVAQILGGVQ